MEDDPSTKLKESLNELQQYAKEFASEYFKCDDMLTVDNDAAVMQGVMAEKEILLEINKNEAVKEQEEDQEDGDNEN